MMTPPNPDKPTSAGKNLSLPSQGKTGGKEHQPGRRHRRAEYIADIDRGKEDPFAPARRPVDYRKKSENPTGTPPPGPNDARLLGDVPPHFGRL